MRNGTYVIVLLTGLLFTSCAGSYSSIKPKEINYSNSFSTDGIDFSYKYNLLQEGGSRKYAKKERTKNTRLVAVKITNNSGKDLIFDKQILLYAGDKQVAPVPTELLYKELKQQPAAHLLYLVLVPLRFNTIQDGEVTMTIPYGIFVGSALAFGNMSTAGFANRQFKKELFEYTIVGTVIKNGETRYGLIGVKDNFVSLSLGLAKGEPVKTE